MSAKGQFISACHEVNSQRKWKTYHFRVFTDLRTVNPELYSLIDDLIVQFEYNKHDLDLVFILLALFLKGLWPIPDISLSVADSVRKGIFGSVEEREQIWNDGQDYLICLYKDMYDEFQKYLAGVGGQDSKFIEDMQTLIWLVAVAIKRQLSSNNIQSQVKSILYPTS